MFAITIWLYHLIFQDSGLFVLSLLFFSSSWSMQESQCYLDGVEYRVAHFAHKKIAQSDFRKETGGIRNVAPLSSVDDVEEHLNFESFGAVSAS